MCYNEKDLNQIPHIHHQVLFLVSSNKSIKQNPRDRTIELWNFQNSVVVLTDTLLMVYSK